MLAMTYRGPYRVRASHKAEPQIEHPNDAIVRVTRSCICGSDLHLYHGLVPDTRVGTTFGHESTGMTPVFGTSVPPSGLSGKMRALAFRYSENDIRHWLILLAADRVNVGEGLLEDLAHGHVPNVFREMGMASEWRHNRAGFIGKAAIAGAVTALAVYLLRRRRD